MDDESLEDSYAELSAEQMRGVYCCGQAIAESEGYERLSGVEAAQYYLMQKHNWLPTQVKGLSPEDMLFCLSESGY